MKKVLFTAKVDSHIRHFHLPYLKYFNEQGYQVHVVSEGNDSLEHCDLKYDLKFGANPFSRQIIQAYKELYKIMNENEFEIIHTHTAIASVLTRIVAYRVNKKKLKKSRVIYTAHGFHFLKGGAKSSWLLFFPIEFLLSKVTDDLILINNEDYSLSEKYNMGKKRYLVNGVGIDLKRFSNVYSVHHTDENFIISYVAEFSENKNQILLIKALEIVLEKYPNIILKLVGTGTNQRKIQDYISKNNLEKSVLFLGYRTDVEEILRDTDLVVATSLREGLPINIIESMAMGLPVIATRCRGHIDLIDDTINGVIVDYDEEIIAHEIMEMIKNPEMRLKFSKNNVLKSKQYSVDSILCKMKKIYGIEME